METNLWWVVKVSTTGEHGTHNSSFVSLWMWGVTGGGYLELNAFKIRVAHHV